MFRALVQTRRHLPSTSFWFVQMRLLKGQPYPVRREHAHGHHSSLPCLSSSESLDLLSSALGGGLPTPLALAPSLTARSAHQRKASVGGERLGVSSCSSAAVTPTRGPSPQSQLSLGSSNTVFSAHSFSWRAVACHSAGGYVSHCRVTDWQSAKHIRVSWVISMSQSLEVRPLPKSNCASKSEGHK